jgi:hypothetical protein
MVLTMPASPVPAARGGLATLVTQMRLPKASPLETEKLELSCKLEPKAITSFYIKLLNCTLRNVVY